MVSEQALPSAPKSADRIDGAMMAGGDMVGGSAAGAGRFIGYGSELLRAPIAGQIAVVEIDV